MKLNKIMKKTVLATMAVLMAAALSFTGCSNGDDDPTPGSTPTGSDDNVLFEIYFICYLLNYAYIQQSSR